MEVVNDFTQNDVWTRIAPHPQRLKDNEPQHWRFHVEGHPVIFLIDEYRVIGISSPRNNYSQDDITNPTGMTAWIRNFCDVTITTEERKVIATVTLKEPSL